MGLQTLQRSEDISKVEVMESETLHDPYRPATQKPGPHTTFLYAATCHAVRSWSEEVGFPVALLGVASDPLLRVSRLRVEGHAARTCFARPYERDFPDGEWSIAPIEVGDAVDLPEGCRRWAGLVRVSLPAQATAEDLDRRLGMLLRPLEALHCAQLPTAVERRASAGKFIPALPRYTVQGGRATLARDLYRLEGPADLAFVVRALEGALRMLGTGRRIFDRIVDGYSSVPDATAAANAGAERGAVRGG